VGRNRISFTSTSSGWLMAKATARANDSAGSRSPHKAQPLGHGPHGLLAWSPHMRQSRARPYDQPRKNVHEMPGCVVTIWLLAVSKGGQEAALLGHRRAAPPCTRRRCCRGLSRRLRSGSNVPVDDLRAGPKQNIALLPNDFEHAAQIFHPVRRAQQIGMRDQCHDPRRIR
jgi:hypothetical protein